MPGPRVKACLGNDDRLLAPLRRHTRWTLLGLVVAAMAAATRFVTVGILPPSVRVKPFAHADASTQVVVGKGWLSDYGQHDPKLQGDFSTRSYTLADMAYSPAITEAIARAAALPAAKIGVLGPLWVELWRSQQWANGPQRDRQIVIEKDPYQITLSQETDLPGDGPGAGPGPPVIDVQTQAPTAEAAARLARAVPLALNSYIEHAQAMARTPKRDRYVVSQLGPVSVAAARTSQLATVGAITFLAVFVLWCGAEIAVASIVRDVRAALAGSKAGARSDRSSGTGLIAPGRR